MISYALARKFVVGFGLGTVLLYLFLYKYSGPLAALAGISESESLPAAVIDQTEWDFGKIRPGKMLVARFEVSNAGGRRLILRKTNGSCDCLVTQEVEVLIEPAKRRTITVDFDTSKISGPARIELTYATNDPRQPLIRLFCLVDIEQQ